jgi:hypothetical protein
LAKDLYSLSSVIIENVGTSQCKIYEVNNVSLTTPVIKLTMRTAQEQVAQIILPEFDIYT